MAEEFDWSFGGIEEEKSKSFTPKYLTHGVHEVTIRNIREEKLSDGKYTVMAVDFEGSEKYEEDGEVKFQSYTEKFFKPDTVERKEKLFKRLIHLFSKVGGRAKEEEIKAHINKQQFKTFGDVVSYFNKLADGKKVRIKLVSRQEKSSDGTWVNGKYCALPNYHSGWAESIDYVPSKLVYNPEREGPPAKEATKVEEVKPEDDDLPF